MPNSTSVAPAPSLGIREFSRQSGYSEAKVRRAMRELSIKGQFQGRGKATLLNPSEQERLALHIDEFELQGNVSPSAPVTPAPKASANPSVKPKGKENKEPLQSKVVQATKAESDPEAIASSTATPPTANNPETDNSIALEQLWATRQAIHNSDSSPTTTAPQAMSAPEPSPSANAPQILNPAAPIHPNPAQSAMTQSPNPAAPQENLQDFNQHQQPSHPTAPQPSQTYYDPYFDEHPAIAPSTQIQPGNHRQTLPPPSLPESYDLAQFRSDDTITTLADPGAIAAQAMGAINALVQGMDADIHQQRIHLEETQRAAHTLRLKAKQLQDKKIEYMIQSSTLGQAQQQSTLELQEALEGIQTLGKSPSDEPTSPSSSPSSPSPSV